MKKIFLASFLLANMLGITTSYAETIHINSTTLSQIKWENIEPSQTINTILSEQQKQEFTKSFAGIASPVAAYKIPTTTSSLNITIESPVVDKHIFVPSAVVLDSHFNIATTYPSSAFKVQEERGFKGNRFEAELNLTPTAGQDYIYLLIYTTDKDLARTTIFPHPSKAYAKATGKQPPAIADIEVSHSLNGKINITVNDSDGTRFIGLPTTLFSTDKTKKTVIGKSTANSIVGNNQAVNTPVDKDTEQYFNQAVTKALKANDINKALNLVNEAEKLGLTSPRQIFLKQVSSK